MQGRDGFGAMLFSGLRPLLVNCRQVAEDTWDISGIKNLPYRRLPALVGRSLACALVRWQPCGKCKTAYK